MLGRYSLTALLTALVAFTCGAPAHAVWRHPQPDVVVSDPYIELHTGPGRGYPVFYVVAQGDRVTVLKRRTDWFKVRNARGKSGWVGIEQMRHTLNLDGEPVDFGTGGPDDFSNRRWELGVSGGDFGGAATISANLGFAITPNISVQATGTQIMGNFSDGLIGDVGLVMAPFPKWRASPFFTIGSGIIRTEPQSTIVHAEDRTDEIVHVGVGANLYISDKILLRLEYRHHTVLTSRDDNEEIDQWKAGFSVFF